jgi:peptide/nickel transport system substrate-binding protein
MKKLVRLFALGATIASLAAVTVSPTLAQDPSDPQPEEGTLGAGEGSPIVESYFGGDITTLNPILVTDGSTGTVTGFLYPGLLARNPVTGLFEAGVPGALASSFEVSEDGTVYTLTLREDWQWTDGVTVNSEDVKYAFDAITSGEVDNTIASQLGSMTTVEAPDAQTVVVTFETADCSALLKIAILPVVPAHKYKEVYPTFADMTTENEYNLVGDVTAGLFQFENFRPGEQVTLTANQNYPDSYLGYVVPSAWIYKSVADQIVEVEQFLAGDITLIGVPEDRTEELRQLGDAGEIQYLERPSTSWHYVYFNLADPTNPQNAVDENGERIEQGGHPIFGDVRVRQAFAHAINHEDLNAGAFAGLGQPVASPILPQSWAYNQELEPYAYDPERAAQLLDEAGFVDDDNDPATPRVATEDALYAEAGTPLEFDLSAFSGNPSVDASTVLMQDQLSRVGFKVNLDIQEFSTFVTKVLSQQFDTAMLFLGPFDPNDPNGVYEVLGPEADAVDGGLNAGSYYNEEFNELMNEARALPGCDQAARKELYDRAQEIFMQDLPVYFVNFSNVPVAAQGDLLNYAPTDFSTRWNMDMWSYAR